MCVDLVSRVQTLLSGLKLLTCNKSSKKKKRKDKCFFHFVTKVNAIYALLVGVSHNGLKVDRRQII